jgi:2-polyprenyl-6-methoxyphenol hydroxylase-like FAD-dependent oxidoreductase
MRVLVAGATGLIGRQLLPLLGAASHDTIALAFRGTRRFDDFQASLGMVRSVLTARLQKLTEQGILERHTYSKHPPRDEYNLTDMVLPGDTVHAMTPNLGEGACQALEDAVVLGTVMATGDRLGAYDRQRRPHAQMITRRSWRISAAAQWASLAAVTLRNTALRLPPPSSFARSLAPVLDSAA